MAGIVEAITQSVETAVSYTILMLPKIIAAIIIVLAGYYIGKSIGQGVNRLIERVGIERIVDSTELGKSYRKAGIDFSELVGNLVWAFVALISLVIALQFIGIGGLAGSAIIDAATYLVRVVGAVIILVFGAALFELLATFVARQLSVAIPEQKTELVDLLKDILFVGLLAFLLRMVFNILLLPGEVIYPLILGVVAIALGIAVSEKLVESITEEHEEFKPIAGFAKFLVLLVFLIIGISGIFGFVPGAITVIEKLAWSVAIAAALLLIPIMYYLAKKLVSQ
jgi:hypothetical protein